MNGNSHTQVLTKSKMQIFLAFILITFTINLSYANDLLQDYIAIDAFRIENQIKSKINSALSVYLKENEYVVNTSIKTKIVSPAAKTASENKKQAISDDNINSRPDFMLYHRLGLDEVL